MTDKPTSRRKRERNGNAIQNPDTVESRIWTLLNEKLERIRQSINAVAEEPEDLHQFVLGIARPGMLDNVFSQAQFVPRAKLDEWFDRQTGQMGGEDAVRVVQDLLGHAQHFDFAQISDRIPKLDLPDLAPFLRLALRYNRRQVTETDGTLAFKTPDAWMRGAGIRPRYEDVRLERTRMSKKKGRHDDPKRSCRPLIPMAEKGGRSTAIRHCPLPTKAPRFSAHVRSDTSFDLVSRGKRRAENVASVVHIPRALPRG